MGSLLKLDTIIDIVYQLKEQNKNIVTTNGCFDIMHVGHLHYLTKAKQLADILIVGINSDKSVKTIKGEFRPINNEIARAEMVSGLTCVDYTFIFDEDTPIKFLKKIKPHVHVKADDYTVKTLPEAQTVFDLGAELKFVPLTQGYSSTDIIDKIVVNYINNRERGF